MRGAAALLAQRTHDGNKWFAVLRHHHSPKILLRRQLRRYSAKSCYRAFERSFGD
jgi:hypothetical protein